MSSLSRASSIRTTGNPTPPPQSDPLGPAAQYPYLPESHSDGVYSCRIGGPRLYDLLNTMSLEPFGVFAWVILDREKEIFEIDDVRDEDKVMQALWFRWIFLNLYVQTSTPQSSYISYTIGQEQIRREFLQWNQVVHQR
jgi:hypothetical protein